MKKAFSLLEVCIALALSTILLTTLFSSLRHLMQSKAEMSIERQKLHPRFAMHLRLCQIFESIPAKGLFFTDPHQNAEGHALYCLIRNGADPDPSLCHEVMGCLYLNRQSELVFELKPEAPEVLLTKVSSWTIQFFDPEKKDWTKSWGKSTLPPFVRIFIENKEYTYPLPRAKREVKYS